MNLRVRFFVVSLLGYFSILHGEKNPFDQFDSDLGVEEVVKIKEGSPSLAETFGDSFVVPDPPIEHESENKFIPDSGKAVPTYDNVPTTEIVPEDGKGVSNSSLSENAENIVLPDRKLIPVQDFSPQIESDPEVITDSLEDNNSPLVPAVSVEAQQPIVEEKEEEVAVETNPSDKNFGSADIDPDALPFLTSDFFAGSLAGATTEQDPMGTQRLLQVKNSRFSPSLLAGTSFKHTSNPDKAENPQRKNSTTLDLTIGVNLGLGEYAVGDYFVCAPAASLMQMRTYNDPLQKFDKDMRVYDADVFIAGLTAPLVLPNDYTLTFSHSYVAPSTFRGGRNLISYSNTPTVTLTKNLPMEDGNMLILVAGMSYTFSSGDTLEEQIADPVYFNFLNAVMGGSASDDYPANLQDGYTFMLSASYMIPYSERISIIPTISYQSFSFTEGMNDGRVDKTFNFGVSASYLWYEWLSLSLMANYTTKTSNNINTPEFDDFIFGGGINVNHSF